MDLAKTQMLLARLYTDTNLRNLFFVDSQAAGEKFGLERDEAREITKLSARQVSFFADSLIRKRFGEVAKLLPLTRSALGGMFETLFRSYAQTNRLKMIKPYQKDAIGFCAFLEVAAKTELAKVSWGMDALRFETAHVKAVVLGRSFSIRLLRYPVHSMLRSVAVSDSISITKRRLTLAIWLRVGLSGQLRFFAIGQPLCRRTSLRD